MSCDALGSRDIGAQQLCSAQCPHVLRHDCLFSFFSLSSLTCTFAGAEGHLPRQQYFAEMRAATRAAECVAPT
jgi:hypothetical protein